MKRLHKPTACALRALLLCALLLCALLICTLLSGCKKEPSSGIPNGEEPPASIGSEPYTPEEVFLLLTNAEDVRLTVIYTEVEKDGTVDITESIVVEKDGDLVKASLADNDEQSVYYYDLRTALGYEQKDNGDWESVSVAETIPDWDACLDQAFSIEGMSSRIDWLFSSDTYNAYDPETGRCVMKEEEMLSFFGSNWDSMTAYLMQSGDTYYLYMTTTDDVGTFIYEMVMEYTEITLTLPG
ncbi:MAG: hypothetical protein ACI3YH_02610 [Eubacteriales bacterium]